MKYLTNNYLIAFVLTFVATTAQADEWKIAVGGAYASGISDVADLYEENMEREQAADVDVILIPLGVAFKMHKQHDNGFRYGFGAGPMFIVAGDASHFEIPLSLGAGYTFAPNSTFSPYFQVGIVHHIASGDYVESSDPGAYASLGMEFSRDKTVSYALELFIDRSELELEIVADNSSESASKNKTINSYDTGLAFYVMF